MRSGVSRTAKAFAETLGGLILYFLDLGQSSFILLLNKRALLFLLCEALSAIATLVVNHFPLIEF
ncbi:hypothetical protein M752DRAFT_93405 [Aspergillus phoenicis ATCC 13157]|uniref:Uncharacterized protein n=1 Tax=Aspergillus phoenicis ATCC 13157 TaxID=1353007 RepID=A0A370P5T8_ASPPH|nr:hypothetical protein M752DRAFT_93405 [Aspergillus phoenicis ATCC 13157]